MNNDAMLDRLTNDDACVSESECDVCYATHDEEIHQATLRIHRWFNGQVTHHFEDDAFFLPASLAS